MTKIIINNNAFSTKKQALDYINQSIMTEGTFTNFDEAKEYLKENHHDIYTGLQCPFCGFTGDFCDFPDLFYEADEESYNEQYQYQQSLIDLGYNIVTCGHCGDVFIQKMGA